LWLCARSAKLTIIAYYPLRLPAENQPWLPVGCFLIGPG